MTKLLVVAMAMTIAASALLAAQVPEADADRQPWLLAGPFPIGQVGGLESGLDPDYLAASGMARSGEASATPLRIIGPASGPKAWREDAGRNDGQGVDFNKAFGPTTYSVAYAYREIFSASARRAALKIGSDDGVKVWINGELALANRANRALTPDEDAVAISLVRGKNKILVKVAQGEGDWGFLLRIAALGDEVAAAASARLASLAAFTDELAVPVGGTVGGVVMTRPAFCSDGAAMVELLGPSGESLASAEVPPGGRFALHAPTGFGGIARLKVTGRGRLAGLASATAAVLFGDARGFAVRMAERARRAASVAAPGSAHFDAAATLELLAEVIEGTIEPSLGGFDAAILALSEIESLAPTGGTRPAAVIRGLARFAYKSPLDGSLQPYTLYLPQGYDASKRYGLVVALHGATGNDFEMASSLAVAKPDDMLIVSPLGRGDLGYAATGERDVLDVMDTVLANYSVDPDRVYLTGRSMGGYGTWRIGQLYPWRFAAIASFAGWTSLDCLENLASTPVLAVHGDADATIPIGPDQQAIALLKSLGGNARLETLPGVGHGALEAWTEKEGPARLFAWFRRYTRVPWPQTTKIRTTMARVGKGAWASILGLAKPISLAALDATIVDSRHIAVDTENVSAFSLDLRHPSLAKGGRILILADGVNLTADSGNASASFELGADGRFTAVPASPAKVAANSGSGIVALFDGELKIVYGARKRAAAADNEAVAKIFAGLGDDAGRARIARRFSSFEVGTDANAGPRASVGAGSAAGAAPSLILVGWPDENAVVARLAPRLPVTMTGGKVVLTREGVSGAGLILCLPDPEAPGRLVGIVALPTRGKAAVALAESIAKSLRTNGTGRGEAGYATPDLILLDRSGKPIWTGCFDWKWGKLTRLALALQ